eukprot:113480-Rhodomonas_salina.2
MPGTDAAYHVSVPRCPALTWSRCLVLASLPAVQKPSTDGGNSCTERMAYFDDFELQTLSYRAPEVLLGLPFDSQVSLLCISSYTYGAYAPMPLALMILCVSCYAMRSTVVRATQRMTLCGAVYCCAGPSTDVAYAAMYCAVLQCDARY